MLPEKFINYIFRERRKMLEKMKDGDVSKSDILLDFTRTSPAVITCGPAGASGSIKMLGFLPKNEYLEEFVEKIKNTPKNPKDVVDLLLKDIYVEEKIDFGKLGGLEMSFGHTWENIKVNGKATLLFFTPPTVSYEVRCDVDIFENGPYHKYLNLMHNLYHKIPGEEGIYPAYIFHIREIYDNSASKDGFGKLIYRM